MSPPDAAGGQIEQMKRELNDRFLKSLDPPEVGRIEISDAQCVGLRFRLSSKGKATWVYEKRIRGGRKRKFALGTWPKPTSLSEARKMAFEILVEANKGIDRIDIAERERRERLTEQASLTTVRKAIDAYADLHLSTIRTGDERKRQLVQSLSEQMDVSVGALTRKDLQEAVDQKAREGRKPYANRIRAALVAFANWCFVRGYIKEPIGVGISKATREKARDRVLSLGEVRAIWSATWDMGELWGPFFRLMILTGQRRGEICKLRWSEVNSENRAIIKPGSQTKNGKAHTTHLSDAALKELELLKEMPTSRMFVFSFDGLRPIVNASCSKRRLDEMLGDDFEPWRVHDLRTAMATALAGAGEPETVVDRILNHSASGSAPSAVTRVYQQSELLPQRAAALDRWADMVTGTRGQVVDLPGRQNA